MGDLQARFQRRRLQPEWMDEPKLDGDLHRRALRGLARINFLSGATRLLWPSIARVARAQAGQPIRILDLASGGGDGAIALARKGAKARFALDIEGWDISSTAVTHARQAAQAAGLPVRFLQRDVLENPPERPFDIVTSSLFLHHLTEHQATLLLASMARVAERLLLVHDLLRTPSGYLLAAAVCRIATRSPVVRIDGPRSVEGAFSLDEVHELCRKAPLEGVRISRRWPQRFLLEWEPDRAI